MPSPAARCSWCSPADRTTSRRSPPIRTSPGSPSTGSAAPASRRSSPGSAATAAAGDARRDHRPHRRRAAVRRGADQGGARDRRDRHPGVAARFADGPARPPARGQGDRPDRRLHRPRVRPRLLAAVAAGRRASSAAALDQLVARPSWSSAAASRPRRSYIFKHALVRDAAYESLLKSRRQAVHGATFCALLEADGTAAPRAPGASMPQGAGGIWRGPAAVASGGRAADAVGRPRRGRHAHSRRRGCAPALRRRRATRAMELASPLQRALASA